MNQGLSPEGKFLGSICPRCVCLSLPITCQLCGFALWLEVFQFGKEVSVRSIEMPAHLAKWHIES